MSGVRPDDADARAALEGAAGFQYIPENLFLIPRPQRAHPKDPLYDCGCRHRSDGDICFDSSCINFASFTECIVGSCSKNRCHNKRLQRAEHANVEVFEVEGKGRGLRARGPINMGALVIEYVGEVISKDEMSRRLRSQETGQHFYMMAVGNGFIDAGRKGNFARFINHSCEPNADAQIWDVAGERRVGIFALRDIAAGEEVCFDYKWERKGFRPIICRCGAASCRGFLGGRGEGSRGMPPGHFRKPLPAELRDPTALVGRWIEVYFSRTRHETRAAAAATEASETADPTSTSTTTLEAVSAGLGSADDSAVTLALTPTVKRTSSRGSDSAAPPSDSNSRRRSLTAAASSSSSPSQTLSRSPSTGEADATDSDPQGLGISLGASGWYAGRVAAFDKQTRRHRVRFLMEDGTQPFRWERLILKTAASQRAGTELPADDEDAVARWHVLQEYQTVEEAAEAMAAEDRRASRNAGDDLDDDDDGWSQWSDPVTIGDDGAGENDADDFDPDGNAPEDAVAAAAAAVASGSERRAVARSVALNDPLMRSFLLRQQLRREREMAGESAALMTPLRIARTASAGDDEDDEAEVAATAGSASSYPGPSPGASVAAPSPLTPYPSAATLSMATAADAVALPALAVQEDSRDLIQRLQAAEAAERIAEAERTAREDQAAAARREQAQQELRTAAGRRIAEALRAQAEEALRRDRELREKQERQRQRAQQERDDKRSPRSKRPRPGVDDATATAESATASAWGEQGDAVVAAAAAAAAAAGAKAAPRSRRTPEEEADRRRRHEERKQRQRERRERRKARSTEKARRRAEREAARTRRAKEARRRQLEELAGAAPRIVTATALELPLANSAIEQASHDQARAARLRLDAVLRSDDALSRRSKSKRGASAKDEDEDEVDDNDEDDDDDGDEAMDKKASDPDANAFARGAFEALAGPALASRTGVLFPFRQAWRFAASEIDGPLAVPSSSQAGPLGVEIASRSAAALGAAVALGLPLAAMSRAVVLVHRSSLALAAGLTPRAAQDVLWTPTSDVAVVRAIHAAGALLAASGGVAGFATTPPFEPASFGSAAWRPDAAPATRFAMLLEATSRAAGVRLADAARAHAATRAVNADGGAAAVASALAQAARFDLAPPDLVAAAVFAARCVVRDRGAVAAEVAARCGSAETLEKVADMSLQGAVTATSSAGLTGYLVAQLRSIAAQAREERKRREAEAEAERALSASSQDTGDSKHGKSKDKESSSSSKKEQHGGKSSSMPASDAASIVWRGASTGRMSDTAAGSTAEKAQQSDLLRAMTFASVCAFLRMTTHPSAASRSLTCTPAALAWACAYTGAARLAAAEPGIAGASEPTQPWCRHMLAHSAILPAAVLRSEAGASDPQTSLAPMAAELDTDAGRLPADGAVSQRCSSLEVVRAIELIESDASPAITLALGDGAVQDPRETIAASEGDSDARAESALLRSLVSPLPSRAADPRSAPRVVCVPAKRTGGAAPHHGSLTAAVPVRTEARKSRRAPKRERTRRTTNDGASSSDSESESSESDSDSASESESDVDAEPDTVTAGSTSTVAALQSSAGVVPVITLEALASIRPVQRSGWWELAVLRHVHQPAGAPEDEIRELRRAVTERGVDASAWLPAHDSAARMLDEEAAKDKAAAKAKDTVRGAVDHRGGSSVDATLWGDAAVRASGCGVTAVCGRHPHVVLPVEIVAVPTSKDEATVAGLVLMEPISHDLAGLMLAGVRLGAAQCQRVADELLHAIQRVHDRGVAHHRLRASCVLMTREGGVRLADFSAATWAPHGMSRLCLKAVAGRASQPGSRELLAMSRATPVVKGLEEDTDVASPSVSRLLSGAMTLSRALGSDAATDRYSAADAALMLSCAAPEALAGATSPLWGAAGDMWALGCVVAHMCLGEPLFVGSTPAAVMAAQAALLGPHDLHWPAIRELPQWASLADRVTAAAAVLAGDGSGGLSADAAVAQASSSLGDADAAASASSASSASQSLSSSSRERALVAHLQSRGLVEPQASLVAALLRVDPARRLRAREALAHEYLRSYRPPTELRTRLCGLVACQAAGLGSFLVPPHGVEPPSTHIDPARLRELAAERQSNRVRALVADPFPRLAPLRFADMIQPSPAA